MRGKMIALMLAAAGGCAAAASAQVTLYLVKTSDVSAFSSGTATNNSWIGNNPSSILYSNDLNAVFIGGFLNGSVPLSVTDPFTVQIGNVQRFLTNTGSAAQGVIASSKLSCNPSTGINGMDYHPTHGLIATGRIDTGDNSIRRFDLTAGFFGAPVVADSPACGNTGSAGCSYDFGPTGNGIDYLPLGAPDGTIDAPACISIVRFGQRGPDGLTLGSGPDTINLCDSSAVYYAAPGGSGPPPNVGIPPELGYSTGSAFYRDIDIDPRNGNIAARVSNQVVYGTRNANGSLTTALFSPFGTIGNAVLQNIQIMHGFSNPVGDLLVWNSRSSTSAGQLFENAVKFNRTSDGSAVTATYLDLTGAPVSFPSGTAAYDFSWDPISQLLFVLSFDNREIYVFSTTQPGACCITDPVNGPGCVILPAAECTTRGGTSRPAGTACTPDPCVTNPCPVDLSGNLLIDADDIFAFLNIWFAAGPGSPCTTPPCQADWNNDGVITADDIFAFLNDWFAAGPGSAC